MRVKAINTDGKVVYGCGFSRSEENNYEGKEVGYLFQDNMEWIDGSEFRNIKFEFIFLDSIELIEEDSSLHYDYDKYLG